VNRLLRILRMRKSGEVYEGTPLRCADSVKGDPTTPAFPGVYGIKGDGSIDAKYPLVWDAEDEVWRLR
jgi:hypothetical protein